MQPYSMFSKHVLASVDLNSLDNSTLFNTCLFANRSVAFYGNVSYSYGGITHTPTPLSSNAYLVDILKLVRNIIPHVSFNSVLVTKYTDGSQCIPYHSDNEADIVPDSDIVTISLGQARQFRFRAKRQDVRTEVGLSVEHGDLIVMSQRSQHFFEHCIPKDFTKKPRISITLRNIEAGSADNCMNTQEMIEDTLMIGVGQKR